MAYWLQSESKVALDARIRCRTTGLDWIAEAVKEVSISNPTRTRAKAFPRISPLEFNQINA